MKIKQLFSSILMTCLIWGVQSAAFARPATDKSIDKLMQLSNISEIFKQNTKDMQPYFDEQAEELIHQITGSKELTIDQQNAALQISALYSDTQQNMINDPEFMNLFKSLFKKTFTEEEVQANIAFLSTPLGQSINQKMNHLMTEILQETTKYTQQQILKTEKKTALKAKMDAILTPLLQSQ